MKRLLLVAGLFCAALPAVAAKADDAKNFTLLRIINMPHGKQNIYPLDGLTFSECDAYQKQVWALPETINPPTVSEDNGKTVEQGLDAVCKPTAEWQAVTGEAPSDDDQDTAEADQE